jgi:hypothetical protein
MWHCGSATAATTQLANNPAFTHTRTHKIPQGTSAKGAPCRCSGVHTHCLTLAYCLKPLLGYLGLHSRHARSHHNCTTATTVVTMSHTYDGIAAHVCTATACQVRPCMHPPNQSCPVVLVNTSHQQLNELPGALSAGPRLQPFHRHSLPLQCTCIPASHHAQGLLKHADMHTRMCQPLKAPGGSSSHHHKPHNTNPKMAKTRSAAGAQSADTGRQRESP